MAPACTPAFRREHTADDQSTVSAIEQLVVILTDMVAMVPAFSAYIATICGALHLPGARHMKVVLEGDVAQAQAELGFAHPEPVSGDEGSDDSGSVVSSPAQCAQRDCIGGVCQDGHFLWPSR